MFDPFHEILSEHLPEVMGQEAENQYIGHGLCRERLGSKIPLSRIQSCHTSWEVNSLKK